MANIFPGPDEISFSHTLDGQPISISDGSILVEDDLELIGNGADKTRLIGPASTRLFDISASVASNVVISGIDARNFGAFTPAGASLESFGGGVIRNSSSAPLVIRNSQFIDNQVGYDGAEGGAIWSKGPLTLEGSTVFRNSAGDDGGGIFVEGDATILNSTISTNTAFGRGSSLLQSAGGRGGGLFVGGTATIENSTIVNNDVHGVTSEGGGVYAENGGIIYSSIVAMNHTDSTQSADVFESVPLSVVSSLVSTDPKLSGLADNGGPTFTHALLDDSPAIDMGTSSQTGLNTDQRGSPFSRNFGLSADIGAYEFHRLEVNNGGDENDSTYGTGGLSLREAVGLADATPGVDVVTFAPSVDSVTLSLGTINIRDSTTIRGADRLSRIETESDSRLFTIPTGNTGTVTFERLHLTGGRGEILYGGGGAIRSSSQSATLVVESSVLSNNEAGADGAEGGAIWSNGPLRILNSTVSQNVASAHGGGVYTNGSLEIVNSTISGNEALGKPNVLHETKGHGGGIFANGNASIFNSTIANNKAIGTAGPDGAEGGGIYLSDTAALTMESSIVADNSGTHSDYPSPDIRTRNKNLRANLIGHAGNIFSQISESNPQRDANGNLIGGAQSGLVNPHLGPLRNNGGVTLTHALLPQSPAIDTGTNPNQLVLDQRGLPRVVDGNDDGVIRIDAGAFEFEDIPIIPGDINADGVIDAQDIDGLFALFGSPPEPHTDLDNSGTLDQGDVTYLLETILGTFWGDANLDGRVDAVDLNTVGLNWRGQGTSWVGGDFNGDGITDAADLNTLALNWRKGTLVAAAPLGRTPRAALAQHIGNVELDDTGRSRKAFRNELPNDHRNHLRLPNIKRRQLLSESYRPRPVDHLTAELQRDLGVHRIIDELMTNLLK